jgi:hypothetical protein
MGTVEYASSGGERCWNARGVPVETPPCRRLLPRRRLPLILNRFFNRWCDLGHSGWVLKREGLPEIWNGASVVWDPRFDRGGAQAGAAGGDQGLVHEPLYGDKSLSTVAANARCLIEDMV